MVDQELINDVLHHANIVDVIQSYIPVIHKGRGDSAVCPFHDDHNPSMSIVSDERGQFYHCWVCGAAGNAITFVQKYEKISFFDAMKKVADLSGYVDPRLDVKPAPKKVDLALEPLYRCINDLHEYYRYSLSTEEGKAGLDYLASRNIGKVDIDKYEIGYAPEDGKKTVEYLLAKGHSLKTIENIGIALAKAQGTSDSNAGRVVFPLWNPDGQVVGFSARRIRDDGSSKYVNSPETPIFKKGRIIYNYHNAKQVARHDGYVYVLEGFMDVIALGKAHLASAVAIMGTALTEEQIELLRRLKCEIRLSLDGDGPGQRAMMKIIGQLNKAKLPYRLVDYGSDGRDPDEILQQEGPDAVVGRMNRLVDAFDFQLNYYTNVKELSDPEERKKVMMHFVPFLRNMAPGIDRDDYIVKLAKATGYEAETIRQQIAKAQRKSSPTEPDYDEGFAYSPGEPIRGERVAGRLARAERSVLHFMLESREAIAFYERNIDTLYDKTYNLIANYITDVAASGAKPEVGAIISRMQVDAEAEGEGGIQEVINDLISIASDESQPPYTPGAMADCAEAISEERKKMRQSLDDAKKMDGKSVEEKTEIVSERAKQRWLELKGRNRKKQ